MSIEQTLERIADALERMAGGAKVCADIAPEEKVEPEVQYTSAELRAYAQKLMANAGPEKSGDLIKFIKTKICEKLSPKSPKLVSIPAGKVGEAYSMLEGYAAKNNIEREG